MKLSRRAALNGVQLDGIHSAIVIQGLEPGTSALNVSAVDRMGFAGQRITGTHYGALEANVRYAIRISKDQPEVRRQIFENVNLWAAAGGWLTFDHLTNRRLYVDNVQLPAMGDARDWTAEYTIRFKAYNIPFWQEANPQTVQEKTVSGGTYTIGVNGNVRTVADITFKNTSGNTLTSFEVTAGGKTVTLSGVSVASGKTISISHGTDGLLRIMNGSTSLYSKYTGDDDLYLDPGSRTITFTADQAGTFTAQVYGRYA